MVAIMQTEQLLDSTFEKIAEYIIRDHSFFCEYQPIVSLKSGEIFGYEALARFSYMGQLVRPDKVFQSLHGDLKKLNHLETIVTAHQLKMAPQSKKIFINYDPHSAVYDMIALGDVFNDYSEPDNLVFELIEDTHELEEEHRDALIHFLRDRKAEIAIDDFGKHKSFFSFELLNLAEYIKLDRELVVLARNRSTYFDFIFALIKFAHSHGKNVILEGVETHDDLQLASRLEVDYVQGFLYRSDFITER